MDIVIHVTEKEKPVLIQLERCFGELGIERYPTIPRKDNNLVKVWKAIKDIFQTEKKEGETFFYVEGKLKVKIPNYIG